MFDKPLESNAMQVLEKSISTITLESGAENLLKMKRSC
jgi:hypothetical protein